MDKQRNIPKLRFPEFHSNWERKKIKELVEIKYGKDQKQIANIDGKYPIMGTGGEMGRTNVFLYDKPSVMIGRKGTIDKPRFMDTPFWTVDTLFYTEVFDNTDPKWLYYKFETINWYLYNEASGVPSLSSSTIYSIPIKTPSLPEQQKIASFFTAIDQKITQLKRKKNLLEQYKKGVMQKIFSQEIRFKDDNGKEFPKWETKTLGEVVVFRNGKAHEQDIAENGKYIVVNSKFISTEGEVKKYTDKRICPLAYGEIVMVMSDVPNGKALAKCFYIDSDNKYTLNQRICALKPIDIKSRFLFYILNRNPYYLMFDSGVGQTNLAKDEVLDCPLFLPKSNQEQTKIANFLSAIDDKITQTQKQIEKAEVWKKGLMQQMFV